MLCVFSMVYCEISGALARTLRPLEYMGIAMVLSGTEWHEVAWHFFDAFMQHRGVSCREKLQKGFIHARYDSIPYTHLQ